MQLTSIEIIGFKSFGKKTKLTLDNPITAIVGPNGSGKSNVAEAIRFVLGEQSIKSMRGKLGTDLIFKGSEQLSPLGRASVVALFDNTKGKHNQPTEGIFSFLQFDEIRITREIYADGANEYLINETKVRLKDVQELLSVANIGTTGHHIISQGEADRILTASNKERKEMIEDALGLKLYQWRIKDAEKKLEKTDVHLREAEISRKEIAPHLQFLKKQVEKIEARKVQTEELSKLYAVYLYREDKWIQDEKSGLYLSGGSSELRTKKTNIESQIAQLEENRTHVSEDVHIKSQLESSEKELGELALLRENRLRSVLRYEAEERVLLKSLEKARAVETDFANKKSTVAIEKEKVQICKESIDNFLDQIKWRFEKHEYGEVPNYLNLLRHTHSSFFEELLACSDTVPYIVADSADIQAEITFVAEKKKNEQIELELLDTKLSDLREIVTTYKSQLESNRHSEFKEEKEMYELKSSLAELSTTIMAMERREELLKYRLDRMVEEMKEGAALIGSSILAFNQVEEGREVEHKTQAELYRQIERLKIKLEDSGLSNVSDIMNEHGEVEARDSFLLQEITDLRNTKTSLESLLADLKTKLEQEFETGIEKINTQFSVFFTDMFNGGSAHLIKSEKEKRNKKKDDDGISFPEVGDEAVQTELGIEVAVSLPQKKVRDLSMLSGGERALTSIALLFAISQVNPPPFLVLDETDAALDEANARRYGKSLRSLAKHSKLIVITHNRETMNQADSLYGVTVGRDGASKLLSVKFDEASEYAK
jgi:chromosome segregation protein